MGAARPKSSYHGLIKNKNPSEIADIPFVRRYFSGGLPPVAKIYSLFHEITHMNPYGKHFLYTSKQQASSSGVDPIVAPFSLLWMLPSLVADSQLSTQFINMA
ncbi:MAG: hypothetical protein ABW116_07085 [Candidatus Sedimenticola sp. 20ELBAFRAG]